MTWEEKVKAAVQQMMDCTAEYYRLMDCNYGNPDNYYYYYCEKIGGANIIFSDLLCSIYSGDLKKFKFGFGIKAKYVESILNYYRTVNAFKKAGGSVYTNTSKFKINGNDLSWRDESVRKDFSSSGFYDSTEIIICINGVEMNVNSPRGFLWLKRLIVTGEQRCMKHARNRTAK